MGRRVTDNLLPADRDAILEMAAQAIEEASFLDFSGIGARKKRVREDATLRTETANAERRRNAETIRALKGRRDSDAIETLRMLADLPDNREHQMYLIEAWPLAWKGWVKIEAIITCNSNSIPPETDYRIRLTERGREVLASTHPATARPSPEGEV